MKLNITFLIALFILCSISTVKAIDLSPNNVYRFKNHKGQYLTVSNGKAVTADSKTSDNTQEWFIETVPGESDFYIRNVSNGAYLKSSLSRSAQWTVVLTGNPESRTMAMTFSDIGQEVVFRATTVTSDNDYMFAHSDGNNNVVCWTYSNSDNTKWTLEKLDKSEDELSKIRKNFENIGNALANREEIDRHLDNLFEDKARTILKEGINLTDNTDYDALPDVLKRMVDKFKEGKT